jgi:predicted transcriptional regulator
MKIKMSDLNIEKEKLEIIKWVTTLKDETSIARLKMLKESKVGEDWWNEISEEEKSAIDKGLADIKAGRVKPHKEAKKLYAKWL